MSEKNSLSQKYYVLKTGPTEVPVKDIKGTLLYLGSGRTITLQGSIKNTGENNAVLEEAVRKIIMGEFDPLKKGDCPKECYYLQLCRKEVKI